MKRRSFLATLAAAGAAVASVAAKSSASSEAPVDDDSCGILIDLSVCEGCRSCEFVCAEANGLPEPEDVDLEGGVERKSSPDRFVTVSSYETEVGEVYVRRQCMHCLEPACTAACLTKALERQENGPVVWNEDKCMGCRYCMISCPFDVPQFEFDSPVPKIQKCKMCFERLAEGKVPVCVEECPAEALTFGKRSELLEIARQRIYNNPGSYVSHIYGEHEAGGTGILYISAVPFADIGFRTDLGETAYPEYTRDFLTAVPVVLFLWPAFLLGLRKSRTDQVAHANESDGASGGAS